MYKKTAAKIDKKFTEIKEINSTPHEIALGFSVGSFIAIMPTPGISFFLGFLLVLVYKKINKVALFAALVLFNPLVQAPIYVLSFSLGNLLLQPSTYTLYEFSIFEYGFQFTKRYLLGSSIIATSFGVLSYFLLRKVVYTYQKAKLSLAK